MIATHDTGFMDALDFANDATSEQAKRLRNAVEHWEYTVERREYAEMLLCTYAGYEREAHEAMVDVLTEIEEG